MIPEEKSAAVSRALQQAFGTTALDSISRMTRGLSSDLVFRIVIQDSPYLLRIMTRINEQMDPHRIYACMVAASDVGLTPRVLYTNPGDGVSITEFVNDVSFPASQAIQLLPQALRSLHALQPFPTEFNYVTAHNAFIWRLHTAALLPQNEINEAFAGYQRLCAAYPRLDADMVSSHMDLKRDNILFDGHRIWLVDWQAAFRNDRYFDLAAAANYLIVSDADEFTTLRAISASLPMSISRGAFS